MPRLSQPPQFNRRWQGTIDDHVISMAWSPDGSLIATASVSGPITIFDSNSGTIKLQMAGHGFGTTQVAWHPDSKRIASCGQDGRVRIWDAGSGKELASLEGGATWVERIAWQPKGNYLASGAGKKLRLWNEKYELARSYPDQKSTVADIIWGLKGKELLSAGYGGVHFWNPDQDEAKQVFEWKGSILKLALAPDGKYLAGGAQDASVHFWVTKTGEELHMSGYPTKVRELSWDSDSRFLATGGGELVTVWDCSGKGPAGTKPQQFELHQVPISSVCFQHRGALLASGCPEGKVALWYPGGKSQPLGLSKLEEGITHLAWSPNDGRLAIGCDKGSVAVYSV
jgi:WD40 repeat protein